MKPTLRVLALVLLLVSLVAVVGLAPPTPRPSATPTSPPVIRSPVRLPPGTIRPLPQPAFTVTGLLIATPPGDLQKTRIFVPGVPVVLKDVLHNTNAGKARTDLSGRFRFPMRGPSRYQVCWTSPGFAPGCSKVFSIVKSHVYLGLLPIAVETKRGKTLFGQVRFADGKRPRFLDQVFGVNAFARVEAVDRANPRGKPLRSAYVNNYGYYILPSLQVPADLQVIASIEAASGGTTVNTGAIPTVSRRLDLQLDKQTPPAIVGLLGDTGGGKHWTAAPGQTISVTAQARDAEGDLLRYSWWLPNGTLSGAPSGSPTVSYTLPNRPGHYELTALVFDGKGGYAKDSVAIDTKGVRFTGLVQATDAPKVAGAQVEINGDVAFSDADGRVDLTVPEARRYVVNVRKSGYGLVSKIYGTGMQGTRWTLTRASVTSVDPKQVIVVRNERKPGDCPGALSDRKDRGPTGAQPQPRSCGPGIAVEIPASALVDEHGAPPAGNVDVELTTVDLRAPDGMPGDWSVSDPNGNTMESWGAGTVELRDAAHRFNLAPGRTAKVTIPIDPAQLAVPAGIDPTIDILSYDEKRGEWVKEGVANRVGNAYVAEVKHFSAVNADQIKQNQSCVRLEATVMPPAFELEVTVPPTPDSAGITKTQHVENSTTRFHVVFNLPNFVNITVRAFENGTNTLIQLRDGTPNPANQLSIPTNGPQDPLTPNKPDFPYSACKSSAELSPFRLPPETANSFLAGLYSFEAANLTELDAQTPGSSTPILAASQAYYDTVDPKHFRQDLTDFKARNGFPTNEIATVYANSGDLGFGRGMHCRRNDADNDNDPNEDEDIACYVTNYGNRFTDDLQDIIDAAGNNGPIATVGMEYSRLEDPNGDGSTFVNNTRVVKFYVFAEAAASPVHPGEFNGRVTAADLDGFGARPVPQLCMVCHGGRLPNSVLQNGGTIGTPAWDTADPTTGNLGARFIPFDFASLTGPFGSATFQQQIKRLNQEIVLKTERDQIANGYLALQEIIDAMYAPGGTAATQNIGFTVGGWPSAAAGPGGGPSEAQMYGTVVTPSCRGCHTNQGPSNVSWATAAEFNNFALLIDSVVCSSHVMPHSLVTHNRFWLSANPQQPLRLHDFLNGADPLGTGTAADCTCIPPGSCE